MLSFWFLPPKFFTSFFLLSSFLSISHFHHPPDDLNPGRGCIAAGGGTELRVKGVRAES